MPIRYLRPAITTSERWNAVSEAAQNFFIRLLTCADDYGRFDARPAVILGHCYSVWNSKHPEAAKTAQSVTDMIIELVSAAMITLHDGDGKPILQLLQWSERVRTKTKYPIKKTAMPADCGQTADTLPADCGQAVSSLTAACVPPTPYAIRHTPVPPVENNRNRVFSEEEIAASKLRWAALNARCVRAEGRAARVELDDEQRAKLKKMRADLDELQKKQARGDFSP